MFRISLVLLMILSLSSCVSRSIDRSATQNVCQIFTDKPAWYRSAKRSVERWGGNIHIPMAIIYQESSFKRNARPPMQYTFGFIPRGRASNAYGYAQALKSTWSEYKTASDRRSADRDDFSDAFDFILWYMDVTQKRNQVSKWDANGHYLNYHEGQSGYSRGSYKSKSWLINVAKKVEARSQRYAAQLSQCRVELDSMKRGWF